MRENFESSIGFRERGEESKRKIDVWEGSE